MSTNAKPSSLPFVIYVVVLLGLVYMFHTELFITGIRLYVAAVQNPKAEQLLGDYYQNNAQLSNELAKNFYTSSIKKYKEQLPTATKEQQASIKLRVGQLYLCGKGVEQSNTDAKQWFDEALALTNNANMPSQTMLVSEIKQGLSFASANTKPSANIPPCHLQSEMEFFSTLKP